MTEFQTRWGDKRYHSLDYELKQRYGKKIYKLSLDGGMTCPNRDGKLDTRGCIFCSAGGSGDFAANRNVSITEQIQSAKELVTKKQAKDGQYIAYFQAFTNTYEKVSYLRNIFYEAIMQDDIVALSIATRPDCLSQEILDLLQELNEIKPVWVELGLQTIHEDTARFIRRGYSLPVFDEAVKNLDSIGIEVIVHVIIGLPNETKDDLCNTIRYITKLPIKGIKLQLLHILKGTDLAKYLDSIHILSLEEYLDYLIACIEIIPPHIVIHRITGDGPKNLLLAPLWSGNKKLVLNSIQKKLKECDTWQGKLLIQEQGGDTIQCNPIQ